MKRHVLGLLAVAVLASAGCNTHEKELNAALSEAKTASAEKDSLLTEVLAISGFVNDINKELTKVKGLAPTSQPGADRGVPGPQRDREVRTQTLARVEQLISRLNASESQLGQAKARLGSLRKKDARLLAQINEYQKTIADLKSSAEQQQAELQRAQTEIVALHGSLDTARAENEQLHTVRAALSDTVSQLTTDKNRVYYVVGTKKELIDKGVVVNEGSKFLVFGSKHLEPARTLPAEVFTVLDKTKDHTIPLPREDKDYKIVSRQNAEYLAQGPTKNGKLHGTVEIGQPDSFWAPSKYLILVQD
jgi:myosin heavy subunit